MALKYKPLNINTEPWKPTETIEITENGTYDVTDCVSANVSVPNLKKVLDATKSCNSLFAKYVGTSIEGLISYSDTSNVTSMNSMFSSCTNLTTIPLLDTSNVTSMEYMFYGCSKITTIPQLDTSNVTELKYTFQNCTSLTSIPLLNTSNVTKMQDTFKGCTNLTTIPLLDTSNVTSMSGVFSGCSKLTTIPQLDTSSCTSFYDFFYGCSSLTEIPPLDTSNAKSTGRMFDGCKKLTTIHPLDISEATSINNMFKYCENLTEIPPLNMISVTYADQMFQSCYKLEKLTILNLKINLTIGSGNGSTFSYGHLLTLDSLINTCKECINVGSTRTLTMGSANTSKIAKYYVKLANGATTIASGEKGELEYQEDVGAYYFEDQRDGAITLNEYMTLKNWSIA